MNPEPTGQADTFPFSHTETQSYQRKAFIAQKSEARGLKSEYLCSLPAPRVAGFICVQI